ncbi:MAG: biotin synthase BioB [Candidatus Omnitrophica bacterium]|nr:biotin synthase BioB [Candidatus Omnitrophota bacterium]
MENSDFKKLIDLPIFEVISYADKVRRAHFSGDLELCSIVNAKSGCCSEDCKFCAQSSHNFSEIEVYPLKTREELVDAAYIAKNNGAQRFGIVSSGNTLTAGEIETIKKSVNQITKDIGIEVCGSLGALSRVVLSELKSAGMTRYHHNIETSERFYPSIVSTHKFSQRVQTIKDAKLSGLEVCSGGIIGMGESFEDRIDMALLLKELNVDSVPINILVPIKGTGFEAIDPISCNDVIRTIAIFRIILEDKTIKIAAGRETMLNDFQALGFMAGANGMLIGGYLTVKGRSLDSDYRLVKEIKKLCQS